MNNKDPLFIDPLQALGSKLLGIEKPGRYVGGEFGSIPKKDGSLYGSFRTAIAFPDLYEIGMSNQALRIMYNGLNALEDILCDRVFAPAPDFEQLLKQEEMPLYTLDLGLPVHSLDLLGFTLAYELGINGVLSILDCGKIPLQAAQRNEKHPLIIMGGPGVSNPSPFARFIDAFWIGEAEDGFFNLVEQLRDAKKAGEGRALLLQRLIAHPSVWIPGKLARRAVDTNFAIKKTAPAVFPIPNIKVVQDHGAVEIMRGCPNGCRFCHAGTWYRPMRQKSLDSILEEIEDFIHKGGYREITLSSLSTGDYSGIDILIEKLNEKYGDRHISFQLPSLKVSGFSLPLIESVSHTRKSGLTFAIETPMDAWQYAINKQVSKETVISILTEAKRHGWRSAKFYFMIGLPIYSEENETSNEEDEIIAFLLDVQSRTKMSLNVNIGTFVPKPHTPFQWVPQISEETAHRKLKHIRDVLRPRGFKISTHDSFVSTIEGVLSRGEEGVGELIEAAYNLGTRLDAWDEYIKKDVWRRIFSENNELVDKALGERLPDDPFPWDSVHSGVGKGYLKKEYERSRSLELTSKCTDNCTNPCGACNDVMKIVENIIHGNNKHEDIVHNISLDSDHSTHRIILSFKKMEKSIFIPHLGLIEIFSKAFIRSGLPVHFTEGFNPLPKMDFASPLPLGIASLDEIASVDMKIPVNPDYFIHQLNISFPPSIQIVQAKQYVIPRGSKKYSTPSLLWGVSYVEDTDKGSSEPIAALDEKKYRKAWLEEHDSLFGLCRLRTYARSTAGKAISYFSAYDELYK